MVVPADVVQAAGEGNFDVVAAWKAYCRIDHKQLIRLRSYLVRGYAETTDPLIECVLRLPDGACWTVLAYWREAA